MNILLIADVSIANIIGGAERVLFEQSTRLASRGHNVRVLTRLLPDHAGHSEVVKGVTECRYDINPKHNHTFLTTTYRNSRKLFGRLRKETHFDCINFYQPFSSYGILSSSLSAHCRKIYTCLSFSFEEFISRNAEPQGFNKKLLFFINVFMRKWIEKKVLMDVEQIVVLSRFTQESLWKTYRICPEKISVVPAGIDLNRFSPAKDKSEIRRKLNIPNEKIILFTVRNLVPRMGLDNLLLAVKDLVGDAPEIFMILGGDGPLKSALITLAKNLRIDQQLRLVGFIPEERLPDYYRAADLFVLPTRELEGFGLITLEAMASGLPVLGTPVGGTKEILGKFDPSFLFKGTDPDSMAVLISDYCKRIKRDPQRWRGVSQRCREFVEKNYSWEKNVDTLEDIMLSPSG